MAAISLSISRGVAGLKISDFTVGTSAPGAGDVELRFNTTDTNSAVVTRKDVLLAVEAFKIALSETLITTTPVL